MTIRYLSVCSGIEAATVAWHPLGWIPAAFSEIEAFPRAVLTHRWPQVPLHGDFTTIRGDEYGPIDLLVGGTPCQSFSVAGLRGGLGDDRGNLALEFLRLADRARPKWLVWENVPGVLSSNSGRDFGSILGGLVELGYGFAYRILDAQHFGVPQRRRRVFVVGCLGDWRGAAAVLFERYCLQGHSPPRRKTGQEIAGTIDASFGGSDENDARDGRLIAKALMASGSNGHCDAETDTLIADTVRSHPRPGSNSLGNTAFALNAKAGTRLDAESETFIGSDPIHGQEIAMPQTARNGDPSVIQKGASVRRLTPLECERLQGFPDGYTDVPSRGKRAADGSRYKALGNSMAVPVMRWIGGRIALVDSITLPLSSADPTDVINKIQRVSESNLVPLPQAEERA